MSDVQNPGSALGEAIGAHMEKALNMYLNELVGEYSCRLITKGAANKKTQRETKLLLFDNFGTEYNLDAVITNEANQPLILVEYKYIRYKKHNRDKGSWICTAHNAVRRRYNSIRSSIAILAGSWSKSSIAMMKSNDVNIFVIPFNTITELLAKHNIIFNWGEKDRHIAVKSWKKYSALSSKQKMQIAKEMITVIESPLLKAIANTLDDSVKREVEKIAIEIYSNLGEVKRFEFKTIKDALDFLEDFTIEEMLDHTEAFTIFDKPPVIIEDEVMSDDDDENEFNVKQI